MRASFAVVMLVFAFAYDVDGQTKPRVGRAEQIRFGLEEPINRPAPIPVDVLRILRQDSDVRACEVEAGSRDVIPAAWYGASQIHLDGPSEIDLIVKAKQDLQWG